MEKNDFFRVTKCYVIRRVAFSERNGFLFVCFISVLTNAVDTILFITLAVFPFSLAAISFWSFSLVLEHPCLCCVDALSFCSRFKKIWENSCMQNSVESIWYCVQGKFHIALYRAHCFLRFPKKVPGRSYLKEKKPLSAAARSKPSKCCHATFRCRLWSSFWFWLSFSCACCVIFICGSPATRDTARSIRPTTHKANKICRKPH